MLGYSQDEKLPEHFYFNGRLVGLEEIGNLMYGVSGSAIGLSPEALFMGSQVVQGFVDFGRNFYNPVFGDEYQKRLKEQEKNEQKDQEAIRRVSNIMKHSSENEKKWSVSLNTKVLCVILFVIVLVIGGALACMAMRPEQELARARTIVENESDTLLELADKLRESGLGNYSVNDRKISDMFDPLQMEYHLKWYAFYWEGAQENSELAREILPELERFYYMYGITGVTIEEGFLTFDLGLSPILHVSSFYLPQDLLHTEASGRELVVRGYDNIVEMIAPGWYLLDYPA